MTREEAAAKVCQATFGAGDANHQLVDQLSALGLLHLETTEDKVRVAAAELLTGAFTQTGVDTVTRSGKGEWHPLTREGAYEIIDVLIKSGFKITHD